MSFHNTTNHVAKFFAVCALAAAAFGIASSAQASAKKITWGDGRDEAYRFCQSMTFQPDFNACYEVVRNAHYFDVGAINFCPQFSFADEKIECLRSIADKYYQNFELQFCASKTFSDEKMACLKQSGSTSAPSIPTAEIRNRVSTALSYLRGGNPQMADNTLADLLRLLDQR